MSDPKYFSIFQPSQPNGLRLPITLVQQQKQDEQENKKKNSRKSDEVVVIEDDELPDICLKLEPAINSSTELNFSNNIKFESILDQIIQTKEEFEENENVCNYTQENDSPLSCDSGNEDEERNTVQNNFYSENLVIKDTQFNQVKNESVERDENEDDDEEDEDIKLIWDSKELLDQIDGRLKMICVDLTSEKESDTIDDKSKINKINSDTSPIVINEKTNYSSNSLSNVNSNNITSPIVLTSKTSRLADDAKQSNLNFLKESPTCSSVNNKKENSFNGITLDDFNYENVLVLDDYENEEDNELMCQIADELQTQHVAKSKSKIEISKICSSESRKNEEKKGEKMDEDNEVFEEDEIQVVGEKKLVKSSSLSNLVSNPSLIKEAPVIKKATSASSESIKSTERLKRLRVVESSDESERDDDGSPVQAKFGLFKKRRNFITSDEEEEYEKEDKKEVRKKDYLKSLSEKKSSKPPPATSPGAKVTVKSKEPESSTVSFPPQTEPIPVKTHTIKRVETAVNHPEPKTISVTGEQINQRTTRLIEPPTNSKLIKRPKATTIVPQQPTACQLSSSEQNISNSILNKVIDAKKTSSLSPRPEKNNLNAVSEAKLIEVNQNENQLSSIDAEKKRILDRIGRASNVQRSIIPKKSNAKALEALKNLKCKETTELFSKIKKKKKNNGDADTNLTQILKVAKYENYMRFASRKQSTDDLTEKPKTPVNSDDQTGKSVSKTSHLKETKITNNEPHRIKQIENKLNGKEVKDQTNIKRNETSKPLSSILPKSNKRVEAFSNDHLSYSKPPQHAPNPVSEKNDVVGNIINKMNKTNQNLIHHKQPAENFFNRKYSLENFLFRILKCSYNWLHEQELHSKPPPVVSDEELMPIVDMYISYEDYYNAMFPLLLLETWEELSRAFRELKSRNELRTYNNVPIWVKSMEKLENHDLISLTCQTVVENYSKQAPYDDEILRLRLKIVNQKLPEPLDCFGYIHKTTKLKQDDDRIMKSVKEYLRNMSQQANNAQSTVYSTTSPLKPNTAATNSTSTTNTCNLSVHEFIVYVRFRKYSIELNSTIDSYEVITSLAGTLRRSKALVSFQHCRAHKILLNPNYSDPIFWVSTEAKTSSAGFKFKFEQINEYNESQQEVIMEASSLISVPEPKLYFIQGPPGTGKTGTIIGIIKAMIYRIRMNLKLISNGQVKPDKVAQTATSFKVLICSPSNGGCDEIARRAKKMRDSKMYNLSPNRALSIVRIGRYEQIHKDSDEFSLELLAKRKYEELISKKQCEKSSSLQEHYKTLIITEENLSKKLKSIKASNTKNIFLKEMEEQLEELVKKKLKFEAQLKKNTSSANVSLGEKKKLEQQAKEAVLKEADIIICTLNFSGNQILDCLTAEKNSGKALINTIIIDEAAQCLEVDFLITLRFSCDKIIQVGDPEQLPATVLNKKAQQNGLYQSFFERVYQRFRFTDKNPIKMLYVQYRMHPEICKFPSLNFYRGKLLTNKDVIDRRKQYHFEPYLVYDIVDSEENGDEVNGSISNEIEAEVLIKFYKVFARCYPELSVGVITPYQKQAHLIKSLLQNSKEKIEVGTVDSYQGREKDVVLFSSVRSNKNSQIGFLSNKQRLNVSLTRAKYGMYVFCNAESLKSNIEWKNFISDAQNRKLICTINTKLKK